MAEEIKIDIAVEDSTAMAKLAELQAQLDKLGGPGAGGMRAGIRVRQIFSEDLEIGERYKNVMDEVAQSTQGVTGAMDELSEGTERAGINIESMITRMAVRMVIFEAARLAIGYLVNEFKEMAILETARVNFENLTTAMEHANEVEEKLSQTAFETNVAFKDLAPAIISLEDAGEGPLQAAADVDTLAKITAATGIPVKELAKGLLDLQLDKTSVTEMFQLAHATGEAKDQMVAAVQEYAELERSIKLADHARDEELATMREQVALQEDLINEELRGAEATEKASVQRINAEEKIAAAQEKSIERALTAQERLVSEKERADERALIGQERLASEKERADERALTAQERLVSEKERADERALTAQERLASEKERADERAITAQERLASTRESFLEKVLAAQGQPPGQVDPVLARAMQHGGLPATAGGAQVTKDIQLGFQQIYKEEDLTTEGMKHFVNTGVIGYAQIMAAAKRAHDAEKEAARGTAEAARNKLQAEKEAIRDAAEAARKKLDAEKESIRDTAEAARNKLQDEKEAIRDAAEAAKKKFDEEKESAVKTLDDLKQRFEEEKRGYQQTITNMAREDAAAKKKERVELDNARLSLEKQITDEVLKQENHAKEFAEAMGTASETWKTISRVFTTPTSEMPLYSGKYLTPADQGILDTIKKGWNAIFPQKASDDLSRIATATEGIHGTLTGAGTP